MRQQRGADLATPFQTRARNQGRTCDAPGCERGAQTRGLCPAHYGRLRAGRPLDTPLRRYGVNQYTDSRGYVILYHLDAEGRRCHTAEHRHVMEQAIGRALRPGETVHHKNGVRNDNRLENLELWSSSHPPGQRVADTLAWARNLIADYESVEAVIA